MRKIGFIVLGLFLIFAGLAILAQSPWGVNRAKAFLENALAKSGVNIEIGKVQGALPHEIDLSQVTIETDRFVISANHLRIKISLLRLLKRGAVLQHILHALVHVPFKCHHEPFL